jgi:selenocysteine lyase/cysteine desulfurase
MATWSRRQFVVGSGAAAVATAGAGACAGGSDDEAPSGRAATTTTAPARLDPSDWGSVRDQFALDPDIAHFAAYVFASHPRQVAEAIERHRAGLDHDPEGYLLIAQAELEANVALAASVYLGGDPGQVAFTDSTTMGIGLVYGGLRLAEGDEVVTTEHDFYSTYEALRLRAERTGARVTRVQLYDDPADAAADQMVERLLAAVTPATRVMAVTWVHSGTGVKLPIPELASALAEKNARRGDAPVLLCVDGVHGLGAEATTAEDLGCDFLMAGTHKWLYGPRGTGIVWGKPEAWEQLDVIIPPFEESSFGGWLRGGTPDGEPGPRATPGGYHTFEHRWALSEAFDFHQAIGRTRVAGRIAEQATQLKEGLAEVGAVRVVTPTSPDVSAGIVCLNVEGFDAADVVERLRRQGLSGSVTPYREGYARFGPGIVTTPEQVDDLVAAIDGLL